MCRPLFCLICYMQMILIKLSTVLINGTKQFKILCDFRAFKAMRYCGHLFVRNSEKEGTVKFQKKIRNYISL